MPVRFRFLILFVVLLCSPAGAATKYWTGGSQTDDQDYYDADNWNPAAIPVEGDTAYMIDGNTRVYFDSSNQQTWNYVLNLQNTTYVTLGDDEDYDAGLLILGEGAGKTGTLNLSGETFFYSQYKSLYVGGYQDAGNTASTVGTLNMTGQSYMHIGKELYLGTANATGIATLSGDASLSMLYALVGARGGTGTLTVTENARFSSSNVLYIGAAGTGHLEISGGTVDARRYGSPGGMYVGSNTELLYNPEQNELDPVYYYGEGHGTVSHTGGSASYQELILGVDAGTYFSFTARYEEHSSWQNPIPDANKPSHAASGTYLLSDAELSAENRVVVGFGRNTQGQFTIRGKDTTIRVGGGGTYVGRYGGTGTVDMYDGWFNIDRYAYEEYGEYVMTAYGSNLYVAESGNGVFNQYGGAFGKSGVYIGTYNANSFSTTASNGVWNVYDGVVRIGEKYSGTGNPDQVQSVILGGVQIYDEINKNPETWQKNGKIQNPAGYGLPASSAVWNIYGGDIEVASAVFAAAAGSNVNIYGANARIMVGQYNLAVEEIADYSTPLNTNFYLTSDGVSQIYAQRREEYAWGNHYLYSAGDIDLGGDHEIGIYGGFASLKSTRYDLFLADNTLSGTLVVQDATGLGFVGKTDAVNKIGYIEFDPAAIADDWIWAESEVKDLGGNMQDGTLRVEGEYGAAGVIAFLGGDSLTNDLAAKLVDYLNAANSNVFFSLIEDTNILISGSLFNGDGMGYFAWNFDDFNGLLATDIGITGFQAVPEPAAWLMLLTGAGVLWLRRKTYYQPQA